MKKLISLLLPLLVFMSQIQAAAERNLLAENRSPEQLVSTLIMNRAWVTYPDYADRDGWDRLLGETNKALLIKRGESKLDYRWQYIQATDYIEYERSGDRNVMQHPNSANNNALSDLVLAELAEGKGRFIDQIINGVFFNCERTSWVLSAHLPAQLSGRTLPDHTEQVIDLGSGEIGSFLSWVYYFFNEEFDRVNPVISTRLRDEIYSKIITPYRNVDRFWWMAFELEEGRVVNNWNPWTNFNCLQAIALLEDDREQLSRDLYRSMLSVDKFINFVTSDGACEEGPSYWGHAAGKLYDYLELVNRMTGGAVSLFDHPMVKDMGEYISRSYVGNNWVVNFADASAKFSAPETLIYRYGKAVGSEEMMGFSASLVQKKKTALHFGIDFFRVLETLVNDRELRLYNTHYKTPEVVVYPETQFYYFKKNNLFLATKGGHNAESHNHNDAGTFTLWANNTPLLIDAGVGTYTRQTFGSERYSIWTMRSNYHNLPSINGEEQKFGAQYRTSDVKINESKREIAFNIAGAYPKEARVKSWVRSYKLNDNELTIRDRFALDRVVAPNEIHFMLWGEVTPGKGEIKIDVAGQQASLFYNQSLFDVEIETIPLPDTRLSNVWGDEIYRVTLKAKKSMKQGEYVYSVKINTK